ncbi:MAG: PTS IIA-like nitrogen regulatory protein PtsN [Pseudomonadota bacterium]
MELTELASPEGVIPNLKATSKKQLLQELAQRAGSLYGAEPRALFDALLERERLGSTGMGRGVAIPHCRMAGVERMCALFARLETPVEFEAVDGEPVDLVFLLIAPEACGSDHLKALARVSRAMRDEDLLTKLRGAKEASALYALLAEPDGRSRAA